MHFLYILMISLANNLDNIGVRLAYSILGIKIRFLKNLWISIITFVISFFAAYCGKLLVKFLSPQISADISAIILTAIGFWIIFSPSFKPKDVKENVGTCKGDWAKEILDDPGKADLDCSKEIDFKEATLLGIACSINNVGGSLGAGMIGLNSAYVGLFSAVISFLALWAGNYVTAFFEKWDLGNKATIIAGVALILLGIKQVL